MTSKAAPVPKLRVTCFSCMELLPQYAQLCSAEVSSDDDELAGEADFDDGLSRFSVKPNGTDDELDLAGLRVALALEDLAREEDVFEIEDGEVFIFKFFGCVGGNRVETT